MKNKNKKFSALMMVVTILHLSPVGNSQASSNGDYLRYENTADFVCGLSDTVDTVTKHDVSMVFRNSNDFPVMLNNYLTLTDDVLVKPELKEKYLNVLISPNRDFKIDCQYIYEMFYQETIEKGSLEIFKGNIRSKNIRVLEVAMYFKNSSISKIDIAQRGNNEIN